MLPRVIFSSGQRLRCATKGRRSSMRDFGGVLALKGFGDFFFQALGLVEILFQALRASEIIFRALSACKFFLSFESLEFFAGVEK